MAHHTLAEAIENDLAVCRKSSSILIAYIASTLLVIVWLMFTIETDLAVHRKSSSILIAYIASTLMVIVWLIFTIETDLAVHRKSSSILVAYIASTLMVIVWLIFTIEITLQENEEDASGVASPGRTAELIKVRPQSDSEPCHPMLNLRCFRVQGSDPCHRV